MLPFEYAARNAGRRPLQSLIIALGGAAVVFLVILMGAFVQTIAASLRQTGDPRNVMVLGVGSEDYLEQSEISAAVPSILATSVSGISRHHDAPLISPEIHHAAMVQVSTAEAPAKDYPGMLRGVSPSAFLVHRQVFITQGAPPGPGEVLAGRLAATKLGVPSDAIRVGKQLTFEDRTWTVSGIFEAPGTVYEAEIWVPLQDLKTQTRRDSISCAVVRLERPQDFTALDVFCKTRLDLEVAAVRETTYYSSLASFFRPMQVLGWTMAALVIISGLFGGMNTMIASVAARTRELACLETIGFRRRAILLSLMQESVLQVTAGALLGAFAARLLLHEMGVRFTMGAITLQVNGAVMAAGLAAGLLLAVGATIFAAVRPLRTPLPELLRS
jgi:putative ABC transport system permease protein